MFPPYLTAAVSQSLQKEEGLVSPLHCWWSSLFLEVSTSNPTGNQLNIASTLLQKKTAWCKHIHVCHISHNNGAYLMCSLHLKPTCTCHQIIVVEVISTTMLFFSLSLFPYILQDNLLYGVAECSSLFFLNPYGLCHKISVLSSHIKNAALTAMSGMLRLHNVHKHTRTYRTQINEWAVQASVDFGAEPPPQAPQPSLLHAFT